LREDAVDVAAVFCRLAAGAFLGEAGVVRFLFPAAEPDAGRLLVPDVTRLGPVAGVDARLGEAFFGAAFLAVDLVAAFFVTVVFFLGDFLVVVFLVAFLAGAAFLGTTAFSFLLKVFNSCFPASATL
jgi:hypothetical protein